MTIRRMMTSAIMCLLVSVTLICGVSVATGRNILLSLVHAADEDPDPPKPGDEVPDLRDIVWHFFDEVKENPYTFGKNVYDLALRPDDFRKIHLEWLEEDPANLAAAANYLDHELSLDDNRILYRQSGELVGAQCDLAIEDMLNNPAYRKEIIDRVEEILKDAKVEVKDIQNYGSWMYQRDLNEDGVPEVIIRSDPQNYVRSMGHELIYTITIDGKEYTLHFRLECGFQPIAITWWTPPQTPPPPSTTPHTTATTATTRTTQTTTETTHGPYKSTDQVVTNDEGGNHNGYVDERPTTTIASEDKYIPGKATSSSQPASTTAPSQSSSTPASSSQPASSGTTGASNVEDKILPSTTVTVRPEAVTTPADDYVAPKEPALTSVAPVDQRIDIPE